MINGDRLRTWVAEILISAGSDREEAITVADILVWSNSIGRMNYGVWRLPILCQRLANQGIRSPCRITYKATSAATGVVDANDGFGHYAAHYAMQRAILQAKESGVSAVGVINSNFFGAGAFYAQQAAASNMISLVTSNSVPRVTPTGGSRPVFGTNPFSFGCPRFNGKSLLVDMATSAISGSTIMRAIEQGGSLPEGIAVDLEGNPITDPKRVERGEGTLLPLGGAKGFGLSLMVDILSGVLTGAGFSHDVHSMYKETNRSGNNGHFMIVIDIQRFIPLDYYFERMETLFNWVKESKGNNAIGDPIRYPGELRWHCLEESEKQGIVLDEETMGTLQKLGKQYAVPFDRIYHE